MKGDADRRSELVALLDLGSNAARFVLARIRSGRGFTILEEEREQTRLAGGRRGRLPGSAVRETLRAAHAFVEAAWRRGDARVIVLATAAVRDADNAETLLEPLRRRYGGDLRILSGEEEARLGVRAVVVSMGFDTGVVVDLGGGSLQVSQVRNGESATAVSLPLGVVRMATRFLRHDPPTTNEVRALRREVRTLATGALPPAADGVRLVGLGGTIRALARIQRASGRGGRSIHGARLDRADVVAIRERLEPMSLRRRRAVDGLKRERADIIVTGAVMVEELMELGGYERLAVCGQGVRYGVLVEETFGRGVPA